MPICSGKSTRYFLVDILPFGFGVFFQVFQSFEESNFSRFLDDTLPTAKQFNFHRFVHVLQKVNILRKNGIYCQLLVLIRTLFFVAKSYAFDMTVKSGEFYRSVTVSYTHLTLPTKA